MPRDRSRAAARLVGGAALVVALVYAPVDLLHVWRDVRNAHAEPRAVRAQLPAASVGIEEAGAIQRAASVMPPTAEYAVVTGPAAHVRGRQSLDYVKFWAAFSLLPRRQTPIADAGWVVVYGADAHALGVPVAHVFDLGGGVSVVQVAR